MPIEDTVIRIIHTRGIWIAAALVLAWFIWINIAETKAMVMKKTTPREAMLGRTGTAKTALAPEGKVQVHGELWKARPANNKEKAGKIEIEAGKEIEIVGIEGMVLIVKEK